MNRSILFSGALLVFAVLVLEIAARFYIALSTPVTCASLSSCAKSFLSPEPLFRFYPELAYAAATQPEDDVVDVLLLGGSVLNRSFTPTSAIIEERLTLETRKRVRVHNLAMAAHTSRDSYLKYRNLSHVPFDLVLFYQGINEARANNAPAEVFDDGYEHYAWYRQVHAAEGDGFGPYLATPYVVRFVVLSIRNALSSSLVPMNAPRSDWLVYGREVKTAAAFRSNLEGMLKLAAHKGEAFVVMTFATHLPDDYDIERFRRHQDGYAVHLAPVELWGNPDDVAAAVAAHNAVIRDLVASGEIEFFVDQQALMPGKRAYWNDICHLTVEGSVKFVDNALPVMLRALASP